MEFLSHYIDVIIFGVLGAMSFIVLTIAFERVIFFAKFKIEKYNNISDLEVDVTRNLTMVGVIGANAPYVGLLGTVVGIIIVFYDMGQSGNFQTTTIMAGLSLALKATAFGLCVAIPSLMIHSFCLRAAQKRVNKFKKLNGLDNEA